MSARGGYFRSGVVNATLNYVAGSLQAVITDVCVNVKLFPWLAKGDGATNDSAALRAVGQFIASKGGGKVEFPPGTYIVGEQDFAGADGLGYAYRARDMLRIEGCERVVLIEGYGARIKLADGLKFGAFDPVTGEAYASAVPFVDTDYMATLGYVLQLEDNAGGVVVRGLEIDGNQAGAELGGLWGDTGRQIPAYGIYSHQNASVRVEDVYVHHSCLDGFSTGYTGIAEGDRATPVTLVNSHFLYNARNNATWFGGIGFTAIGCRFNLAGRGTFASAPGCGLDIEAEGAVCRAGLFIDCEFGGNNGLAMGADSGDTADVTFVRCRFYASQYYSILPNKPRFHFIDCLIAGCAFGAYAAADFGDATRFTNCRFSGDETFSGEACEFGAILFDFQNRVLFDGCSFRSENPNVHLGASTLARYVNCTALQNGSVATSVLRGEFMGGNSFTFTTGVNDYSGATFYGNNEHTGGVAGLVYNGEHLATSPQFRELSMFANNGGLGTVVKWDVGYEVPAAGTYAQGSRRYNALANGASGTIEYWLCTVGGTPGTWQAKNFA